MLETQFTGNATAKYVNLIMTGTVLSSFGEQSISSEIIQMFRGSFGSLFCQGFVLLTECSFAICSVQRYDQSYQCIANKLVQAPCSRFTLS